MFASQLQFQSRVLEVLNSAVTLGFVMQTVCPEVCFFARSLVENARFEAWIVTFGERLVENAR